MLDVEAVARDDESELDLALIDPYMQSSLLLKQRLSAVVEKKRLCYWLFSNNDLGLTLSRILENYLS